jgi:GNAT superfamily N-acetyltransferase
MIATFGSAAELPYRELAALFEQCFVNYVVPMRATASALENRNRIEHVDLTASLVARQAGEPIALALVARRGRKSRLAAMGVVLEARGTGVGRALTERVIEEAQTRNDDSLVLECIASNERALRLYRSTGFAPTRRLVGWRAGALMPEIQPIVEVDPTELGKTLARGDDARLPWQIATESLIGLSAPMRGWTIDGTAFAVGTVFDKEVSIRAVFTRPERRRGGNAARLVRGLAALFAPLRMVMPPLVPEGLGGELAGHLGLAPHELAQLEMVLPLSATRR